VTPESAPAEIPQNNETPAPGERISDRIE
jgi:hypothetical protein